jgi:sulfate permease, SulP family
VSLRSLLPLPPLSRYSPRDLPADLSAALAVCFLAVPQGLAYATIAGLPPAMGLYAAAVPTIVGSLFRSSRYVVAGPTNALSLLVGAAVATGLGGDPVGVALTLALMVGAIQLGAGLLRLGAVVDYISGPVVLGYISGAAVLIGAGQLYNAIATTGPRGTLVDTLRGFVPTVGNASGLALGMAAGTVGAVIVLRLLARRMQRRVPDAMVAMLLALVLNVGLDLESHGLQVLSDLSPIPAGFPPPTLPDLASVGALMPVAVACAVLSLVESSAVARSLSVRTGQRLDASTEFAGQGLSNIAAAFFSGYPVSGSLSRSALTESSGAKSRVAGMLSGVLMIGVLLAFGPVLDHTPIASLAGLLFVVAWDLVDGRRLLRTLRTSKSDALALLVTVISTFVLDLDTAIYMGVGVSVVLFLRRARVMVVREMFRDADGNWQECKVGQDEVPGRLPGIRILQAEGPLFFGSTGELMTVLDDTLRDPRARVVILRLKRAQGMDATVAASLAEAARQAERQGRWLVLVALDAAQLRVLERSGAATAFPPAHLLTVRGRRFEALEVAVRMAEEHLARQGRVLEEVRPPPALQDVADV